MFKNMWKFSKSSIDCNKSENVVKYYLLGKASHVWGFEYQAYLFYFHWNVINITNGSPNYIGHLKGKKSWVTVANIV